MVSEELLQVEWSGMVMEMEMEMEVENAAGFVQLRQLLASWLRFRMHFVHDNHVGCCKLQLATAACVAFAIPGHKAISNGLRSMVDGPV